VEALLILAVLTFTVVQEPDSTAFLRQHDTNAGGIGRAVTEAQILGLENGFDEANAFLLAGRQEIPMYCQPTDLTPTGPQLIEMLRNGVAKDPSLGKIAPKFSLFRIMQKDFPCPYKSPS